MTIRGPEPGSKGAPTRACQRLWMAEFVKRFSGIEKQALRKLDMLHTARQLNDPRASPANRSLADNLRN